MINIIKADDWIAIYKDGKLVVQNHSLHPEEVLAAAGVDYESEYIKDPISGAYISFPEKLEDFKR